MPFYYADRNQWKRRPAAVVSVDAYHDAHADAIMVALTARRVDQQYFGDCPLLEWRAAGLPKATKAKGVLRTIERSLIVQRLGSLTSGDMGRLKDCLRSMLDL